MLKEGTGIILLERKGLCGLHQCLDSRCQRKLGPSVFQQTITGGDAFPGFSSLPKATNAHSRGLPCDIKEKPDGHVFTADAFWPCIGDSLPCLLPFRISEP